MEQNIDVLDNTKDIWIGEIFKYLNKFDHLNIRQVCKRLQEWSKKYREIKFMLIMKILSGHSKPYGCSCFVFDLTNVDPEIKRLIKIHRDMRYIYSSFDGENTLLKYIRLYYGKHLKYTYAESNIINDSLLYESEYFNNHIGYVYFYDNYLPSSSSFSKIYNMKEQINYVAEMDDSKQAIRIRMFELLENMNIYLYGLNRDPNKKKKYKHKKFMIDDITPPIYSENAERYRLIGLYSKTLKDKIYYLLEN